MEERLPKVLVVGIGAWRADAANHTLEQIFSCWDPARLALVYTRADSPDSQVASRYFQISESEVIKSAFRFWRSVGEEVRNNPAVSPQSQSEHRRYARAHKRHSYFLTICRELVWWLGHWKSRALAQFVRDFAPDVIFCPVYPTLYMSWIQRHIIKLTGKPSVCFMADDNYSYLACNGLWAYLHRFFLRPQVRYHALHCHEMFVIVEKEKEETDAIFGTDSVILTKGLDFSGTSYRPGPVGKPLKFVYTGNLLIGRAATLALLADVINQYDAGKGDLSLDVYAPDPPDARYLERINRGCCRFRGNVSRETVHQVQQEADVVVFAESLKGKESHIARLSFSTKITDYLYKGKCVLAIAKEDVAPIDYFRRNDAAIIASSAESLRDAVRQLSENPGLVAEYGRKAYECAKRNHDKMEIDRRLIATIKKAAGGNG